MRQLRCWQQRCRSIMSSSVSASWAGFGRFKGWTRKSRVIPGTLGSCPATVQRYATVLDQPSFPALMTDGRDASGTHTAAPRQRLKDVQRNTYCLTDIVLSAFLAGAALVSEAA